MFDYDIFPLASNNILPISYNQEIPKFLISPIENVVIFFDRNNNKGSINYFQNNLLTIKEQFQQKGKHFVLVEEMTNVIVTNALSYQFPFLTDSNLKDFSISQHLFNAENLLNILQYKGSIIRGLIFFDNGINIVELNSSDTILLADFLSGYLQYLDKKESVNASICFSLMEIDDDEDIQIDLITQEEIRTVIQTLDKMKDKGTFLFMLPILKKYIQTHSLQANTPLLSRLYVDEEFRLILPDYNYMEIKLNSLAKAIYLLFLLHSEGIHLKEMEEYEDELMKLYLSVSNQTDIEKMRESVKEIVNPNSNAIYMHLSKIKSAFTKAFCYELASHYYINGNKNEKKRIALQTNLISWYI
jgi:hypothetical protein